MTQNICDSLITDLIRETNSGEIRWQKLSNKKYIAILAEGGLEIKRESSIDWFYSPNSYPIVTLSLNGQCITGCYRSNMEDLWFAVKTATNPNLCALQKRLSLKNETYEEVCPLCWGTGKQDLGFGYWVGCPRCNPDDKMGEDVPPNFELQLRCQCEDRNGDCPLHMKNEGG